jgi:hypothetical protein
MKGDTVTAGNGPVSGEGGMRRVLEGTTKGGRTCRLVDNTGTAPRAELQALLGDLIEGGHFGVSGLSSAGSHTIPIGGPAFTHVQLGDRIYRLIVTRYEARLEPF